MDGNANPGGNPAPERIGTAAAAGITGKKQRTVQVMAQRGLIPGSAKIGGQWTFNELTLRRWVRQKEEELCRATSTSAARRGGPAFTVKEKTSDGLYERLLGLRQ